MLKKTHGFPSPRNRRQDAVCDLPGAPADTGACVVTGGAETQGKTSAKRSRVGQFIVIFVDYLIFIDIDHSCLSLFLMFMDIYHSFF